MKNAFEGIKTWNGLTNLGGFCSNLRVAKVLSHGVTVRDGKACLESNWSKSVINGVSRMEETEIKNDPQISGRFMIESFTNDRNFMKRRCGETVNCIADTVNDVCIKSLVETSSRQMNLRLRRGNWARGMFTHSKLASIYLDLTLCGCFTLSYSSIKSVRLLLEFPLYR